MTVHVQYSRLIDPKETATEDDFVAEVQRTWDQVWANVHAQAARFEGKAGNANKQRRLLAEESRSPSSPEHTSGSERVLNPYEPKWHAKKAGLRTSWVQVRFLLVLSCAYGVAGWLLWTLLAKRFLH